LSAAIRRRTRPPGYNLLIVAAILVLRVLFTIIRNR